jgi:tRNA uridine 5-carboxymethylaminomethyl modification enzyme
MRLAHAIHLNHGDLLLSNRILQAALGGVIGRLADATALQKRILNASRGPAVWALRAQTDQWDYARQMLQQLQHTPNLHLREAMHAG